MDNDNRVGTVEWQSPSNIALVKYWGKHGVQLPRNPSISFTLSKAHTKTKINYQVTDQPTDKTDFSFKFEGQERPDFAAKIAAYFSIISNDFPLIRKLSLEIESSNSFPHSSGIASSASAMSALSLCLLSIEQDLNKNEQLDFNKASHLARLGSGSASRSVFGPIAIWGASEISLQCHDEYAIAYSEGIDEIFYGFHDDILIVSKNEKSVSSRAGHALMVDNPYAPARFEQARTNLIDIVAAMQSGDLEKFGSIVEKEALTLHALMMASEPPYMLMEPNSLIIINKIQKFRRENNIPVYFTLDAGPNIHMLYPTQYQQEVSQLKEELKNFCVANTIIEDQVGTGPIRIS